MGVELNPQAVEDARANARSFGVAHAEFHTLDAAAFARSPDFAPAWNAPGALAVMDPPRPGLSADAPEAFGGNTPWERWIYVSCNPDALAQDLAFLSPPTPWNGSSPWHSFPHTPHMETAALLRRK